MLKVLRLSLPRIARIASEYGGDKAKKIIKSITYHEKEDFMWQLFGIDTTPQDTIDYRDE